MRLLQLKSVCLVGILAGSLVLAASDLLVAGHKVFGVAAGAAGLLTLVFAVERWTESHSDQWFRSGFVNGVAAFLVCVVLYLALGYLFTQLLILDTPGATASIDGHGIGIVVLVAIPIIAGLVIALRGVGWFYRGRNAA